MADQKINALPVKTSPTTGDKMLMIGSAEEYQIDYDQLATAILNKLTSKTFTLDQGTKSLVAALNELNSNFDLYLPINHLIYKKLKQGDDMNDYAATPGVWSSLNTEVTNTLLNRPSGASGGGILMTINITGGTWSFQLFITNNAQIYFRVRTDAWKQISTV